MNNAAYFSRTTILILTGAAFFLFLPLGAYWFDELFLISLFSRIIIFAIAAVCLDFITGYAGMVSLGHAAFFGIGAYVTAILSFHSFEQTPLFSWPFLCEGSNQAVISWLIALIITSIFAFIIGALSIRTKGIQFIMITLAFGQMLFFMFVSMETYGGDDGLCMNLRNTLPGLDPDNDFYFYYICLFFLFTFLFVFHKLVHSRFGMVINGCRQNEKRMIAIGYPVYRYKLVCFIIACTGTGLAGALLADHAKFVSPDLLHWLQSGELLIMVILGGLGTLFGPVVGAVVLMVTEELLSSYTEHWLFFLGPILILSVLFSPQGIWGLLTRSGNDHD